MPLDSKILSEWFRYADMDLAYAEHGLSLYPPLAELRQVLYVK
jgi:hypothetical protein